MRWEAGRSQDENGQGLRITLRRKGRRGKRHVSALRLVLAPNVAFVKQTSPAVRRREDREFGPAHVTQRSSSIEDAVRDAWNRGTH